MRALIDISNAIILSTAEHHNALLATRNTKDFDPSLPIVRLPYIINKNSSFNL